MLAGSVDVPIGVKDRRHGAGNTVYCMCRRQAPGTKRRCDEGRERLKEDERKGGWRFMCLHGTTFLNVVVGTLDNMQAEDHRWMSVGRQWIG